MDNSTTSGNVGELKEESNHIIYIIGLILLIIWKVAVMCQVRLHLNNTNDWRSWFSSSGYKQNTPPFVLDDVVSMQVTNRKIATDDKLIYFVEADDGSGVALQGDRGPSGVRGLKGDSGGQGPSGRQGPA